MNVSFKRKGFQFPRELSGYAGSFRWLTYDMQIDTGQGPGEVFYEQEVS